MSFRHGWDSRFTASASGQVGLTALLVAGTLLALASPSRPQSGQARIVCDRPSYNAGDEVRFRLIDGAGPMRFAIRYSGETKTISDEIPISASAGASAYGATWRVPADASTGRYEIVTGADGAATTVVGAFTVYRKLVKIAAIQLDKTYFTSGDNVRAVVRLKNLANQPVSGLRVEFSDRYWPWIGLGSKNVHIVTLGDDVDLDAHQERDLVSDQAAVAEDVKRPAVHQYGVVVWDKDRQRAYDIAFSQMVWVNPPGVSGPRPYPAQYINPDLESVNTAAYRQFYPPALSSAAIRFDESHTMWPAGSSLRVSFNIMNPTAALWDRVHIRAVLHDAVGDFERQNFEATVQPHGQPQKYALTFHPRTQPGSYYAEVEIVTAAGDVLAWNGLQLAVNPLPQSILVFCAHEDDEMDHGGFFRAAIENDIPIHFVYFTSGDAGSCDRYYAHSCDPAEALNFGQLRMDEVRAALGHLGVPRENIFFAGLPDGGLGEIWYRHHNSSEPYLDALLATDHAPYEGVARPNLPFSRDAAVGLVKEFIRRFRPDVIYTPHPGNVRHIDHIADNYLVVEALQNMVQAGEASARQVVWVDEVPDPKVQPATPYHYRELTFAVSGAAKALVQEAGWYYQSQTGNRAQGHIRDFDQLPRSENFREVLDWNQHQGWNERSPAVAETAP
jgi:LmbE family N-acetylglucosaminyl deacetylase